MSPKNPAFNSAIENHLDVLRVDLAACRIEEIASESAAPV